MCLLVLRLKRKAPSLWVRVSARITWEEIREKEFLYNSLSLSVKNDHIVSGSWGFPKLLRFFCWELRSQHVLPHPPVLRYNWRMVLCKFKKYRIMNWHIYYNYHIKFTIISYRQKRKRKKIFGVKRTFRMYSLNFHMYQRVVLTIVTV